MHVLLLAALFLTAAVQTHLRPGLDGVRLAVPGFQSAIPESC